MQQQVISSWLRAKLYFADYFLFDQYDQRVVLKQSFETLQCENFYYQESVKFNTKDRNLNSSNEILDTLCSVLIKLDSFERKLTIKELSQQDQTFLSVLHFNYLFMRSLHFEFLEDSNIQIDYLSLSLEMNFFKILLNLDVLFSQNKEKDLVEQFKESELYFEQSIYYYLKLKDLQLHFSKIIKSRILGLCEQNFIYLLSFEGQEIFGGLSMECKKELSDISELPQFFYSNHKLRTYFNQIQGIIEKSFDYILLNSFGVSIIEDMNQIVYYDFLEQNRGSIPKGPNYLLDIFERSFCQGIISRIKKNNEDLQNQKKEFFNLKNQTVQYKALQCMEKQIKSVESKLQNILNFNLYLEKCYHQNNYAMMLVNQLIYKNKAIFDFIITELKKK